MSRHIIVGLTEMLGSYMLDLFLLEGSTAQNLLANQRVEDLDELHELDAHFCC